MLNLLKLLTSRDNFKPCKERERSDRGHGGYGGNSGQNGMRHPAGNDYNFRGPHGPQHNIRNNMNMRPYMVPQVKKFMVKINSSLHIF